MRDIIIIGAGPAGLTAAIYALRADKDVLIIEKGVFGGQITFSPKIENYPGFTELSGNELADKMMEQVINLGGEFEMETVKGIKDCGDHKEVITSGETFQARTVIIATGASHRRLGVPKEEELTGNGISFCAVCDGAFYENQDVTVIGGGNSALQEAVLLSTTSKSVTVIQNLSFLTGEEKLAEELKKKSNVSFIYNSIVTGFEADTELRGVNIKNTESGEEQTIPCAGCFVAIGLLPATDFIKDTIKLNEYGYVDAGENCKTDIEGIFCAGDCRSKEVRQITTACADGAAAALAACKFIN